MCNKVINGKLVNDTCESCGMCRDDLEKVDTEIGELEYCLDCRL